MADPIAVVYASAPVGQAIIHALIIESSAMGEPHRLCNGFVPQTLGREGVYYPYDPVNFVPQLPAKNSSGAQTLTFQISDASDTVRHAIDKAVADGVKVTLTYLKYNSADKAEPAEAPITMTMSAGTAKGMVYSFQAGYYNILDTKWMRQYFTAENAPGVKYMS